MKNVMRRTLGICLLGGAAALCGATASAPASADLPMSPVWTQRAVETCANAPADATVTFGANMATVGANSPNMAYSHPNCDAYIVDINVTPATASAPGGYVSAFTVGGDDPARDNNGLGSAVSQADCSQYVEQISLFKKGNGESSFGKLSSGTYRGVWQAGPLFTGCMLTLEGGGSGGSFNGFNPPSSGTDVYRVVTSVHLGKTQAHARGFATHLLQPPK